MNSLQFEEDITVMVENEITNQLNLNDDSGNSKLENKVSYFLQSSELLLEFVDSRADATAKIAARQYIESDPGKHLKQFVERLFPTGLSNNQNQGMHQGPTSAKSSNNFDPIRTTQFNEAFENYESNNQLFDLNIGKEVIDDNMKKRLMQFGQNGSESVHIPQTGSGSLTNMQSFYRQFIASLSLIGLEATPWNKLKEVKSCLPPNHNYSKELLKMINISILQRLEQTIPQSNEFYRNAISQKRNNQDGYGALYQMLRRTPDLTFLKEFVCGWSKKWEPNVDPDLYAAQHEAHADLLALNTGREYSPAERSLEMIHQALRANISPELSQSLRVKLLSWLEINKDKPLPPTLTVEGITNSYADYWKNDQH